MSNSNILPNREANAADFKTQNIKNSYVTKYTRGGKYGKQLVCPECDNIIRIYHFAWSALGCTNCNKMIDKYSWELQQ